MLTTKAARISLGFTLLLVSLTALLFIFFIDLEEVGLQLRRTDPGYLSLAAFMLLAGYGVYAVRWQLLLHKIPSWLDTFHASNLGHMMNMLLPLRPGEPMRIWALNRSSGTRVGLLASSVVIERMLETLFRLAAFSGILMVGIGVTNMIGIIIGFAGFLLVTLLVLLWMVKHRERILQSWPRYLALIPRLSEERSRQSLADLIDALVGMSSPRNLTLGLLTSGITAALFFGFHYFTLLALDFPIPQSQMLALSLGILAISPPSAPTLPGVYHAQFIVPFAAMGISASYITSYTIILYAIQAIAVISFGAWALFKTGASLDSLFRRRQAVPVAVDAETYPGN